MNSPDILQQLITMSRRLADPALDYVILAEGNTSAWADEETFWVKASGVNMPGIGAGGFVRVRFAPLLAMLDGPDLTDAEVKEHTAAAKVDPSDPRRPSVETVLHALALQLPGVRFVGHTHPTATNALTCSQDFDKAVSGRLFPDEIVYCGPSQAIVPWTDPGLPLARKVRDVINQHMDDHREVPKVILMQNHGLIALGQTVQDVENITAMAVKTARVLLGTAAFGGPHFLSPEAVRRIHTRPDEAYRRSLVE
ncbi:MAG TPA: class II aldolase/adducin family protein [Anaerolineae bacterium]|jgi:rhamnose utilization protein RhaD (predicted bifunctional aldolase and dehydrogenase)|nr:class II aldolase/adducin family protein [Anaerolineae bacterium]